LRLIKVKLALVDKDHLIASSYVSDASGQWEQKLISITGIKRAAIIDRAFERGGFSLVIDDTPDHGQTAGALQTMMAHATNRKIANRVVTVYIYKIDGVTLDATISAAISGWSREDNKFRIDCVQEFGGKINSIFEIKTILAADWPNAHADSIGQIVQYPAGVIDGVDGEMPLWRIDASPATKYLITWSDPNKTALVTSIDAAYDEDTLIPPADYSLTRNIDGWEYLNLAAGYSDDKNIWIKLTGSTLNPVAYLRAKLQLASITLADDGDGGTTDFQDYCTANGWTIKVLSEINTPRQLMGLWCNNFDCFWYVDTAEVVHIKHIDWTAITADVTLTERHFLDFAESVSMNEFSNSIRAMQGYNYKKNKWDGEYIYDTTGGDILAVTNRREVRKEYLLGVFATATSHPAFDQIKYIDHPIQIITGAIDLELYRQLGIGLLSILDVTHYLQIGASGNYLVLTENINYSAGVVTITAYRLWGGTYTNVAPALSIQPLTASVVHPMPVESNAEIDSDRLEGGVVIDSDTLLQVRGLGIKTAATDNHINLIEGAIVGVALGPLQKYNAALKLLELLLADVNIGDTPMQPGTGGTWSTAYDSAEDYINKGIVWNGKLYVGSGWGASKIYAYDGSAWSLAATLGTGIYSFCIQDDALYVGGVGKVYKTTDGALWPEVAGSLAGLISAVNSLISVNLTLYASGALASDVYSSNDNGATWVADSSGDLYYASPGDIGYFRLGYFGGYIYAGCTPGGGIPGMVFRKQAGGAWGPVNGSSPFQILPVYTVAVDEQFVCDPIVWNNKLYFGTTLGKIHVMTAGGSWSEAVDLGVGNITCFVEYQTKLLAGFAGNKIHQTVDGLTWTLFATAGATTVYGMQLYLGQLYALTGSTGLVLVYTDATIVTAPNLQVFGNSTLWGQFRPGDAPGIIGSLLMADPPYFPKWLPPGTANQQLVMINGVPVYKDIILVNIVCYEGDALTYENEVLYA
jgi:hypothetical protein